LQGLPGVGSEKAERLLARFGSVEAVISASSSELQTVDGIGKSIADKIKWAVSEQVSPSFSRPFYSEPSSAESVTPETKTIKTTLNRSFKYEST
jgi:NAD-dependent DNA ligase